MLIIFHKEQKCAFETLGSRLTVGLVCLDSISFSLLFHALCLYFLIPKIRITIFTSLGHFKD